MEKLFAFRMDRPFARKLVRVSLKGWKQPGANGFTLLESLVCLLIVCVLLALAIPMKQDPSVRLFLGSIQHQMEQLQLEAYVSKQKKTVVFERNQMVLDGKPQSYPTGITCQPVRFSYNASGHISMAGRLACQSNSSQGQLLFQLGSGSMHIE